MQEMARAQSRNGGERAHSEDTYPFSTLAVWRKKLAEDMSGEGVGEPAGNYRLRLLLEQASRAGAAAAACALLLSQCSSVTASGPSPDAPMSGVPCRARMWSKRCWGA